MTLQEKFLLQWHTDHAGASDLAFGSGRLIDGRSSYQALAQHAQGRTLDLACGDGPLSALIDGIVVGLDMSSDELVAARTRLGPLAELHLGRAQELPFLDESFDVVLCHMALMLMDDLSGVVSEIRRVLRPRGIFAFVVGREWSPPSEIQPIFAKLQAIRESQGRPSPPPLGDPRCRSIPGLQNAFRGWTLRCEDLELYVPVPTQQLPAFLRHAYYGVTGLGPRGLEELDRWILSSVEDLEWPFSIRLGIATAPPRRA